MKAIDLRVRAETLDLARALAEQRGGGRADLLREALDIGMLVIAASGPPAEHSASEVYGTLTGVRLAQRLRPCVATLLDFLHRYGAAPLTIMAVAERGTPAPHSPPQIPLDMVEGSGATSVQTNTIRR
jgi:hypothetical protein